MIDKEQLKALGESIQGAPRAGMSAAYLLAAVKAVEAATPTPDSPTIELKGRPSLAELWKDHSDNAQTVGFISPLAPSVTDMVVVPVNVVEEWKERIDQLQREVSAYGLHFEAVISNPPKPWQQAPGVVMSAPAVHFGEPAKATPLGNAPEASCGVTEGLAHPLGELRQQRLEPVAHHIRVADEELKRQLATAGCKVKPYLNEDVYIESCPVIGRAAEPPLDLSDLSI